LSFEVFKQGGTWGCVAAIDVGGGGISQIPGLSVLSFIDDFITLKDTMVVIASADLPSYRFPEASRFDRPFVRAVSLPDKLSKKLTLYGRDEARTLKRGLAIASRWELSLERPAEKLLCWLLHLGEPKLGKVSVDTTLVVGSDPNESARLFVSWTGDICGQK